MFLLRSILALLVCAGGVFAATFGTSVALVGGASDLVLDEARGRLYLVASSQSRVEVYSLSQRRFLTTPVRTDATPISAAISRNGKYLYVTSYEGASLNIIDLDTLAVVNRISLPARPEGVAVGRDERVLISTIGTGANNLANVLLVYDPTAQNSDALMNISVTPPPPTPPQLPPAAGRPFLQSRSQLMTSRDGSVIIGVNIPTGATTRTVFVYEVASATVLRSRNIASATSVLSVSPDGSKFMAGLTLFETATLNVLAQQNIANSPYPIAANTNFNTQTLQGGSAFSPDGGTLYSGFDISPIQTPAARANISQLMLSDPDNLLINLGLQLPENLAGKMIISNDGANIYALSESGFIMIPIGTMRQFPIAEPDVAVTALANDQCGFTSAQRTARVMIRNTGRGNMTASAQALSSATTGAGLGGAGGAGGGIPGGGVSIILPPGTTDISQSAPAVRAQQMADGTAIDFTFSTVAANTMGTISPGHDFLIQSSQAINIPSSIRVFQNNRNTEARGELVAINAGTAANESLEDLVYDATRQRIYIANSGRNRVEVFDTRQRQFLSPIKVGQLPRSIGMSPDGSTLYVANSGGESISIVDTDKMRVVGSVKFPPIPFNASQTLVTPSVIAVSQRGAMFMTNTGQLWSIIGDQAVPRGVSPVIGADTAGRPRTIAAPRSMASTPNGERVIILGGDGFVYLYDALADEFIQQRQVFTGTQTGYFGPVTAGPRGQYFAVNGTVLNEALTPISSAPAVNVNVGGRNVTATPPVAAVAPVGAGTFVRFTQGIRMAANTASSDTGAFELVDINTGNATRSIAALEGPLTQVLVTGRANIGGRTMAVDASGSTVYAITTTGLSILPLDAVAATDRPTVNARGAVNLASYQTTVAQNNLLSIFGRNLAGSTEVAGSMPLPTRLGGICVTLGTRALPLFMASSGQINAQIPPELATGTYALTVRSFDKKVAAAPQNVTVSKYAPAVLVEPVSNQILLYHEDGKPVTRNNPAKRDRPLTMYALGLGLTKGGTVRGGEASPSSPLAVTDKLEVFFGNPLIKEAGIIVDWSGLAPGFIGLYQINLRVPGDHLRGDALPVTIKIGGVSSPTTGPIVPTVAVD